MKATVLQARPMHEYALLGGAVLLSMLVHCAGAATAASIPPRTSEEPIWVEMTVAEPAPAPVPEPVDPPEPTPEPEPVPEPPPEPEPVPEPPPEPETVDYEPEPAVDEPPPPQPDPKPVPRKVQGIDANSFATGGETGLSVNRGNTTAARATDDRVDLDEELSEFAIVPYTSITQPPRARYKPRLVIPQSIIDAEIEGRVEILLTIDASGKVQSAELLRGLHPEADAACLDSMRKSRWKPGSKDGVSVITQNVPYSCRFEMAVD